MMRGGIGSNRGVMFPVRRSTALPLRHNTTRRGTVWSRAVQRHLAPSVNSLREKRGDLFLVGGERGVDHVVHVVVLVRAETTAEHGLRLGVAFASYCAYRALSSSVLIG